MPNDSMDIIGHLTYEKILGLKIGLASTKVMIQTTEEINEAIMEDCRTLEGRIRDGGYIVPGSMELVSRSLGMTPDSDTADIVVFRVEVRCLQVFVGNGDSVPCRVRTITKMGVQVFSRDPDACIRVLLPREFHQTHEAQHALKEGDSIDVVVLESDVRMAATKIDAVGKMSDLPAEA